MHLSLLKKMHSEFPVLLIGYDTDYLEAKLLKLGYKPITINVSLNTKALHSKKHLSSFLDEKFLYDKNMKCIYASGLEGREYLHDLIESKFSICGNNLSLLNKSGFIENFAEELRDCELKYPETYSMEERPLSSGKRYLFKPLNSCGGYDISQVYPMKKNSYIQEHVRGDTYSCSFIIDNNNFRLLGFNRLLNLNSHYENEFIHAGALMTKKRFSDNFHKAIEALARRLKMRGFNGIDFIFDGKKCYIIDINPRITSPFFLYNDINNDELLKGQILGKYNWEQIAFENKPISGFAHIFAREDVVFTEKTIAEINCINTPKNGDIVKCGNPIFTLLSRENDYNKNIDNLQRQIEITKEHYNIYDIIFSHE